MRVSVLASGSGGNACVVESGTTRVLVDAGLSGREIEKRLRARAMEPESIAGIFITHEHHDHSSGALAFSTRWGCPVFTTPGTASALGLEGDLFSPFVPIESGRDRRIGALGFRALATPHDANQSVAYAFEADDGRIVIASDLGRVEPEFVAFLRDATTLLLEFNHDEDMLRDGPYTWFLKKRISGGWGHLSNRQSAGAIRASAGPRLRRVIATHLSRANNAPVLALAALAEALERAECGASFAAADQVLGYDSFDA
ncbi:MAG: MBL fold metallo-hydrolase [Acidobacteriota bacterium]|nr:MBL fold metallo-hydrolase [Acidobacteriota bacterium]